MKHLTQLFLAVALTSVGACKKPDDKPPAPPAAVVVNLAPEDIVIAKRGEIQTGPRISGTLEASQKSVVRAEAAGSITQIVGELGDTVKKGALLVKIEAKAMGDMSASARAGLASAQAQFALAQKEVARTSALVKGGAAPARDLDRAQGELQAAQAQVAAARSQVSSAGNALGDASAKVPFDGVIAKRSVSVGDVVSPGTELYTIIDPKTMRLDASVAADDLSLIKPGTSVDFNVRGYPDQKFAGAIQRVAPAADAVTRQIQVLVDIPNPGGKLVAGLYAEGRVAVERREALIVPLTAIDSTGDQPTVLKVKDGIVERTIVGLGLRDDRAEMVEVTSGVIANDVLVLSRAQKNITPGTKVNVPGQAAAAEKTATTPPAPGSAAKPAEGSATKTEGSAAKGSGK